MLCALSQFLNRNFNTTESLSALKSPISVPDPDTQNCSPEKAKNTFFPKFKISDKNRGGSRISLSKFFGLSATQDFKSFPNNEQYNNCFSDRLKYSNDSDKNTDCEDIDHASRTYCSTWSESCSDTGACRSNLMDQSMSHAQQEQQSRPPQGRAGSIRQHTRRHLPVPTGSHTVGCVDLMCDVADHGTFFRLFYPTNPTDIHKAYKQWPLWLPRKQYAHGYMYFLKKNLTIFGRVAHWLGGDVYVPVLWQAPLLQSKDNFPVIIVSHGIGGNRTTQSTYCSELASRGFVVAAVEHRDGTASMTLCLKEQVAKSIMHSYEVDKSRNNNDSKMVNKNDKDNYKQLLEYSDRTGSTRSDKQCEKEAELQRQQSLSVPPSQHLQDMQDEFSYANQMDEHEIDEYNDWAKHSKKFANNPARINSKAKISRTSSIHRGHITAKTASVTIDKEKDSSVSVNNAARTSAGKSSPTRPHKLQLGAFETQAENRSGVSGRGARLRQRREDRRRALRHNHSCSEDWRPFQHVEVWDDFNYRNGQMYHRAAEISDLLDELISMNEGSHINNALGFAFTTEQFKNRLDLTRVAVAGHSFGGAAALATLVTDDRFKVGLCLDSWMHPLDTFVYSNTYQPTLFLNMEQFQWQRNVKKMVRFQQALPQSDRPMLTVRGGCHQSMTDFQFMVPQVVGRLIDVCHTLQPAQCMSVVVDTSLAFLRKHLGLPMELHDKDVLDCKHPHLLPGTNVDLTTPDDGPTPP
ncbi:hypothetical protein RRG08_023415 [Elysia crispata]|uniref:1-alkyl-2-acetylglycerophosphocholine esterase n=1 Tax=Elysia crispata TaxID=231223 RepID=A0AAE0YEI8_9GAST|nr:hypothetical protein RRG08_023415 [Elysia crispata]